MSLLTPYVLYPMTLFIPPHDIATLFSHPISYIATLFSHPISYIQYILPKQPLFKTQNFNAAPLDHYQIPVYILPQRHSLPKQPYILPKQPYILPTHPSIPPTKPLKAKCLASRYRVLPGPFYKLPKEPCVLPKEP